MNERISRGGPIACMSYVIIMMFLPMFEMDCMGVTVQWSGVQLVTGDEGSVSGSPSLGGLGGMGGGEGGLEGLGDLGDLGDLGGGGALGQAGGDSDMPQDWALLALPVLALIGILAVLMGSKNGATAAMGLLLAGFIYFSAVGFAIEREIDSQLEEQMSGADAAGGMGLGGLPSSDTMTDMIESSMKKTGFFWLGLVAAGAGLIWVRVGAKPSGPPVAAQA